MYNEREGVLIPLFVTNFLFPKKVVLFLNAMRGRQHHADAAPLTGNPAALDPDTALHRLNQVLTKVGEADPQRQTPIDRREVCARL